ncbi:alpha/beta hydrolase domain-containing protein [Terracidiphilus gabretensis]|uniref:alpha/beta hydrolase domain-containing protein n=1 Tax=Terracidiphilus gabretensis TaxID=1577687 RepID=UPI00071B1CDF|nr:alpha/beta hydrolase domain-containing protein [Terracidiphilus gabretensis]
MFGKLSRKLSCLLSLLLLALFAKTLFAHVERVEIASREDVLDGKIFGAAGAYERITGTIYFSIPVNNPQNAAIVDLKNAINLRNGEVEFSADFMAIQPKNPKLGNGSLLLENPNRGRSGIIHLVDGGDWNIAKDAGDAWLLRQGFSFVTLGWQWDAAGAGALGFHAPIARENGKTITGLVRGDLMLSKPMPEIPLGHLTGGNIGGTEYAVSAPDDARNTLTVRDSRNAPRRLIPRAQWQFAHTVDGKLVPSDRFIHLDGGFEEGKIYEYVYVASDPVVAGGSFAAFRDFASWAKHDPNTLTPAARVYGEGISQNGRFLRDFLYQGFNTDEEGRMALDGVLAHVAGAGRGNFNYRFAQPSRDAQPTSSVFYPVDIFPFTDEPETDPTTGEKAGLLDRAVADKTAPKIFFSNTSYEYWGRAAALIHITADGKRDATISSNVRIYHLTGLQHFSGPWPLAIGKGDGDGQEPQSPLPVRYFWRAMITNMDAWVRSGTEPPPSSYPRIADGTLAPIEKYNFPKLPGVNLPYEANGAVHLDFGPEWKQGIATIQPPKVSAAFPVLVPQVDADGNEKDGVRLPEITIPLATVTGWNLRDPSIGAPAERLAFEGSWIAFPKNAEERKKTGDPRLSIAERYSSEEDYLTRYSQAVDELIRQHWILPEDRDAMMARAKQEWMEALR